MLIGYADETGVHNGAPVAIWGGYVAPSIDWSSFQTNWNARLERDGLDHFHMSHFKADKPPFDRLKRVEHELLERDLSGLIADHGLRGVAAAVHRPGWDGKANAITAQEFGDSVKFGFHISLREFSKFGAKHHPEEKIDLIYGSGFERPIAGFAEAFASAGDSYADRVAGINFRPMREEPGIQAADMFIWEFNSQFKNALKSDGTFQVLRGTTLDRLCRGGVSIRMVGREMAEALNNYDSSDGSS